MPVDISSIPQQLATAWNIDLFPAQLIVSTVVLCLFLFPTLMLTRRRNQTLATLLVGFMTMGSLIAIGWLPVFMLVVMCLGVAVLFGKSVLGWFGRGR